MPLCKEVQNFIAACERIHGYLGGGKKLTEDEMAVLEIAATEFLAELRSQSGIKHLHNVTADEPSGNGRR